MFETEESVAGREAGPRHGANSSERLVPSDGPGADQSIKSRPVSGELVRRARSSRCNLSPIGRLLAVLASIHLLKSWPVSLMGEPISNGDPLTPPNSLNDHMLALHNNFGDNEAGGDELSRTIPGPSDWLKSSGDLLEATQNLRQVASLEDGGAPPTPISNRELAADQVGSSSIQAAQSDQQEQNWSPIESANNHRAAIVRSEFGEHAESSELEHQISSMLANQTSGEKSDDFSLSGDQHETQIGQESSGETHRNASETTSLKPVMSSSSSGGGGGNSSQIAPIEGPGKRAPNKTRRNKKKQPKDFRQRPEVAQDQSQEGPSRMVTYVSSLETSKQAAEQSPREEGQQQQQRSIQQPLVGSSIPLQFMQFGRGLNNLYNLLPNYRDIFSPNLGERPEGRRQVHLVSTFRGSGAMAPSLILSGGTENPSLQHDRSMALLPGPFELEQLQASSSSVKQQTKFAGDKRGKLQSGDHAKSAAPSAKSAAESSAHEETDDSDEEPDDSVGLNEAAPSGRPHTNEKSDHHSSRSVASGDYGEPNAAYPQGQHHGDNAATPTSTSSHSSGVAVLRQSEHYVEQKSGAEADQLGAEQQQQQQQAKSNNRTANHNGADRAQSVGQREAASASLSQLSMAAPLASGVLAQTNELLVGPFKSEAEAPATITLAGVVYQKSGASSALIRAKQVPTGVNQANGRHKSATLADSPPATAVKPASLLPDSNRAHLQMEQQSHQQQQIGPDLWPAARAQLAMQNNLLSLPQSVLLDQAQQATDSAVDTQAALFQMQSDNALRLSSGVPASNLLASLALRNQQQFPIMANQASGGLNSMETQGEQLTLSSSNSKPTTSKSIRSKEESLVLTGSDGSRALLASNLFGYAPSLSLAQQLANQRQPVSLGSSGGGGSGSTTIWTIGKLPGSSTDELVPLKEQQQQQQQLNALLQQAGVATSGAGNSGEQLASIGTNDHPSQLEPAEQSQASESKTHAGKHHHQAPIVIVQKDVKPVKYHLLRAYLKLRRLLRPFEATYVFPNENLGGGGGGSSALLRRRQLRLGRSRRSNRARRQSKWRLE